VLNEVKRIVRVMMKKPTKQQVEELNHMALLPDEAIDTSYIPKQTNWENAIVGRFYSKEFNQTIFSPILE
jgi:hypothetical protein